MNLRHKFRNFLRMPRADRMLVVEAILFLGIARCLVVMFPFRFISPWLSRAPEAGSPGEDLLIRLRRAVTAAARNVPWNAVCLPQAIAVKAMLARRGCGSSFYLGAGFDANGKLIAHAWLVAGGKVVVGETGISAVAALARFG